MTSYSATQVRFLVTLHKFTTRITMLLCLSRVSCDIFFVSLPAFWSGWDCGQDREGPLG